MYVTNLIAQEAHKLLTPLNFQTTHSEGYEIMYESDLQRISLRIDGTFLSSLSFLEARHAGIYRNVWEVSHVRSHK